MKFLLKEKEKSIYMIGNALLVIRDQQASEEVLQYIVEAMNEKWERDPQELQTHPEPTGNGKPLGGGRS